MRVFLGFDDTDVVGADRGTGKFARWFEEKLPPGIRLHGVVRQQLPVQSTGQGRWCSIAGKNKPE